ncbi:alpha/beta hydrolase [Leptolyngbyaceae cyanobacterium CCMR0082]|uniref:Alpha/beta hydrolase n=2 Tax=Adonisia turfae TaxID=2950184 RepID=A0A6M0S2H7_9CYAN|nr:alpha/beta hydrolase [Adonisia turfae]MDV3347729.1 alpha/beta hydrolase [Leptothoe sp. LEGE 181152]NEZ60480.1 alpha/beta hydrolase [Adonisia turfae CCMR0081]NEZ62606.1 alpha/beta hydrolase [Adonisia turfae CCMR0082]
MSWEHKYVKANSVQLHYVTQGSGKLLILLHGLFEFWYSWRHQLPYLSRHFKVVVPDLRGYNDSDKPRLGYDLDTLSSDIHALIHSLGYNKAHIVGHDWGGAIAWNLAHRFPKSVDRLAVLSTPQRWQSALSHGLANSWEHLQRNWHLLALQTPGLPQWLIKENLPSLLKYLFQQQAVRKSAFTQANTDLYQAALQKPGVIPAVLQHVRHCFSLNDWLNDWFTPSRLSTLAIASPTLLMWGEDDNLVPATGIFSDALSIEKCIRRSIPDCGHWIQQEAPNSVNRELIEFLS